MPPRTSVTVIASEPISSREPWDSEFELVQRAEAAVGIAFRANSDSTADTSAEASAATQPAFVDRDESTLAEIMDFPQLVPPEPSTTFHPLQEWEGYVVNIGDMDFTARLVDLTAGRPQEDEEAIVPLTEISHYDRARMREGSYFRWVIGYESTAGTRIRVSQIVFRDLPATTPADLRIGQAWARKMTRALNP